MIIYDEKGEKRVTINIQQDEENSRIESFLHMYVVGITGRDSR